MKTINVQNFNNKFSCDVFLSIAAASKNPIKESELPMDLIIRDMDTKVEFHVQLITLARMDLHDVGSIATYAANGVPADEFVKSYKLTNVAGHENIAIYVYKKM